MQENPEEWREVAVKFKDKEQRKAGAMAAKRSFKCYDERRTGDQELDDETVALCTLKQYKNARKDPGIVCTRVAASFVGHRVHPNLLIYIATVNAALLLLSHAIVYCCQG